MFKKLLQNKKAQQTAEYALLIALVVAAVVAMQTYAQRAIQGRIRDAARYMTTQTSALGSTNQYEPYYTSSAYNVDRRDQDTQIHGNLVVSQVSNLTTRRGSGGFQEATYSTALGLINGL